MLALLPLLHGMALVAFLVARQWTANPLPHRLPEWAWAAGHDLLSFVNELAPFLFAPLPLWLLVGARCRTREAWLAVGLPWALFLAMYGDLFLPRAPHVVPDLVQDWRRGTSVRVMTFNLLWVNGALDEVAAIVRAADPDVLAAQEVTPALAATLDAALAETYPHRDLKPDDGPFGTGLWSRYPLGTEDACGGEGGLPEPCSRWQQVVLSTGGGPLRLVNVHLSTPAIHLRRSARWPRAVVPGQSTEARRREIEALVAAAQGLAREPLVVAGDFNLTDQAPEYRRLRAAGLRDAYREAGWGFGHTFPAVPVAHLAGRGVPPAPLVRIDYVLHSAHLATRRAAVWPASAGSDHRPVVADLRLIAP